MKRSHHLLRINYLLIVLGFIFLIATEGVGQTITLSGGNQNLTITTGIPGGELVEVVNTNCTLAYYSSWSIRKITVRTTCNGQSFNLSVLATNVTWGVAAGEVALRTGEIARNLITDIPRYTNGTCRLQYTASATFAQGNRTDFGNDRHRVYYTITGQ